GIDLSAYTILDLRQAKLSLDSAPSGVYFIDANDHTEIWGGILECNGDSGYQAYGIQLYSKTNVKILGTQIKNPYYDGIGVRIGSSHVWIEQCTIEDSLRQGISITEGSEVHIYHNYITNSSQYNIDIEVTAGKTVTNVFISNNHFNQGKGIAISADGTIDTVEFSENIITLSNDNGVTVAGTGTLENVVIDDNVIISSTKSAIYVLSTVAERISIQDNTVEGNGEGGIDVNSPSSIIGNTIELNDEFGINVGAGAHYSEVSDNFIRNNGQDASASNRQGIRVVGDYITITGNKIIDDQGTPTQQIGIEILAGSDNHRIQNNYLRGNPTAISDSGSNNIIKLNTGYVTENAGTAIIPANAKSHQVSFEMAGTPTVVKVTPQFDVSGRWWISNLTWASGTSILSGAFNFNRTYSGLYSGIIHWNAEYIP
ncbi:MAG: right-handed parallel beta-helix repeat-containing protein, partial [Candidatus Thorarchaeota archaeon]